MVAAEPVLRLHQSPDGRLWFGDDLRVASDCGEDVNRFICGPVIRGYPKIRLLGTPGNADLIERLHILRKKAGLPTDQKIQVGSPVICRNTDDPIETLRAMWHWSVNQGLGGRWVELEDKDFATYSLIAELQRTGNKTNEKVRQILRYHPAWPALSFLPILNTDVACQLVATIVDPRWFIHPVRPNRANKLFKYMGLTPKNVRHLLLDEGEPDRGYYRAALVVSTWMHSPPPRPDLGDPRSFLHRILGSFDCPARGFLAANKKFLRFMREVWLQGLTPGRRVFCPSLFFRERYEAEAYEKHLTMLSRN